VRETKKMTQPNWISRLLLATVAALLLASTAYAATPGIAGAAGSPVFNLTAQAAYLNMPDGQAVYSWGYGCNGTATFAATLGGVSFPNASCPTMQVPGPTLIVHEGDRVTVNLSNGLPTAAGNTSILFPGFKVTSPPFGTGVAWRACWRRKQCRPER
jgi:FtsP/CotA-like multicopper oxidase with cupredoxin domain